MNSNTLKIGFAGKRILRPEQEEALRPVLRQVLEDIVKGERDESGKEAEVVCICPLAEGSDTVFAEAVVDLGYRLKVLLPFEKAEYLKDFSEDGKKRFERIYASLDAADRGEVAGAGATSKNELFMRAGEAVVDASDYLVAVWDDTPGKIGGTGDSIRHALGHNEAQQWKAERDRAPQKKLVLINYTSTPPTIRTSYLANMANAQGCDESLVLCLHAEIAKHEVQASRMKRRYHRIWQMCLWLGLFAAVAFSVGVSFKFSGYSIAPLLLSGLELGLILGILLILLFAKPKRTHGGSLFNRFIAEELRLLKCYFWSGIPLTAPYTSAILKHINTRDKRDVDVLEKLQGRFATRPQIPGADEYRAEPIEQLVEEQLSYHESRHKAKEVAYHRYLFWSRLILACFVAVVVVHFCALLLHWLENHNGLHLPAMLHTLVNSLETPVGKSVTTFLAMFFTACLAKAEAIKVFRDWEKLALESEAMKDFFVEQAERLRTTMPENLPGILRDINREMFYENLDWQIAMLDKEPPL